MTLGEKLQKLRQEKGLSQEQLAEELAVSRQAVGKWESGQSRPEMDKLVALAALFGVSTDYLLREDGTLCRPASLRILEEAEHPLVEVAVTEGRYHQVKRMFVSVGRRVLRLKRISIGKLVLDPCLEEGECREMGPGECSAVFEQTVFL